MNRPDWIRDLVAGLLVIGLLYLGLLAKP